VAGKMVSHGGRW
jgi:hypothetical protein